MCFQVAQLLDMTAAPSSAITLEKESRLTGVVANPRQDLLQPRSVNQQVSNHWHDIVHTLA
jgi:hypothetical protein